MEISLKTLGSPELQQTVIDDMFELVRVCKAKGLKPLHLVVGKFFIEVGCAQSVRSDGKIADWAGYVDQHTVMASILFNSQIKKTYDLCEKNDGIFDSSPDMKVIFDPDEPYMVLQAIGTKVEKNKKFHYLESIGYDLETADSLFSALHNEQ